MRVEHLSDTVTLYLGDCRDIADWKSADLILTDPPYGFGTASKGGLKARSVRGYDPKVTGHVWPKIIGDDGPFDPTHLLGHKNIVLWGANNYASRLPDSPCWFAWDRKAGKAADSNITDCELAWVRGLDYKTVRIFRHMWAGFQRDTEAGQKHLHPSQKPVALMNWCLGFFPSIKTVADPYMGSGSTGVAAVRRGLGFVGIELSTEYFEVSCKRLEHEIASPSFFVGEK